MAEPPVKLSHPSPRGLRDLRHIRRELCNLYREGKAGSVEPPLLGRLVNCLNVLQALDNCRLLDQRITDLEAQIAAIKPNGHDREARL